MLIAIIEDEKLLAKNIKKKLEKNGYLVNIFNNISSIQNNHKIKYDLYIIDISLPDGSGFELIKWLREVKKINAPIIITSGYNDTDSKIYGLGLGADDYLAKPFSPDELIARVKSMIRRSYEISGNVLIKYRSFVYDTENKTIKRSGEIIDLNKKEMEIVDLFLLSNLGKLVEKNKIISAIWGDFENLRVSDNTINVTLSRIRTKLGDDFKLKTIIGHGYTLEK